jgi:prevent-host-death family protein
MATLVNVNEAKTHLSHLLERVRKGEEFVLAKAGKPYARLVPLEERSQDSLASRKDQLMKHFLNPSPGRS